MADMAEKRRELRPLASGNTGENHEEVEAGRPEGSPAVVSSASAGGGAAGAKGANGRGSLPSAV